MKTLKITTEAAAYSEDEAREYLDSFKAKAAEEGYIVGKAGYTYKTKKAKGEIVGEMWVCSCTAIYNDLWDGELE